jgi:hypothetical protein
MSRGRILLFASVVAACACAAVASFSWWCPLAPRSHLHAAEIGHGHSIQIWSELDWHHTLPAIYYEIRTPQGIVVPKTFLGVERINRNQRFNFQRILTNQGDLIVLHAIDRERSDSSFVVVFDFSSGESWPRHRHEDDLGNRMSEKWAQRFDRIQKQNPGVSIP